MRADTHAHRSVQDSAAGRDTEPATTLYVYAIGFAGQLRQLGEEHQLAGLNDAPARTIEHGDLCAVVSENPHGYQDLKREHLLAHQRVLEGLIEIGDILPVSYGTVATGDEDVVQHFLEPNASDLLANLNDIQGRIELNLRVFWNQDRLFQEIADEFDDIRMLRDRIAGTPESASYYDQIRLGELTAQAIGYKSEQERDAILQELAPLAVELQLGELTSETMVVNVACLVDRDREPAFDEAIQRIARSQGERLQFRYVGPLPPASFVSVRMSVDEFSD